ncbi:hypothetical protein IGI04_033434, partial [Brassica rapa subsp. trilocularis]
TLPIECPSRFCNGSSCLLYAFNLINSDANYEIFNCVVSVGSIDDCNWRRRCDLKVLECLTIPEISGGICAERGLLLHVQLCLKKELDPMQTTKTRIHFN